jgi:Domain of unknown function (DUF4062)
MPFENDLLISYAHIDDQSLLEGQSGWVSTLHRILEIRVAQLLGEKPRIWRDPKLQGNDYFSDTILSEQIPRVAALLAVLSPRYIQSEWCVRELEEFCRASERSGGIRIADKARIFKVIKTPVPRERHPEPLQPLLGYEFYVTDSQTGRPRELSHVFGPEAERQFLARLDDLAWDICQLLQLLRANGSAAPELTAAPRATVYLAETSFDLREEREAIRRDLLRNGYEVLPDRQLPLVAADLEAFVREQVARCALSIHLIGRGYGVVPDGTERSVVSIQHETAAARRYLPRLLWLSPGSEAEDERQRSFLEHLRTAPGVHDEAELLEIPLEDLKSRVHLKLAPPELRKERTAAPVVGGVARIYLICDREDLEAARPIEDFLFDQGFEVLPTLFDEDESQARLDHEESLCTCDAVFLFQGQASEMWLRRKMREIQKSAGLGRRQPLLAQGLYLAAPWTAQKERFRTLEALVLREPLAGFSSEVLEPFLGEIVRQRRARA